MAEAEVRVALLARAGKAREQLRRALGDAGANVVAEGDPAELDPVQVRAAAPTVFLVSLEPAVEAALERFDELLAAPDVEVMFDDAEVTGKLDGWDLNRWARHVASKLLGSAILPPAPEGAFLGLDHAQIDPGAPPTPAELMDGARLEDYTADASELADSVPVSQSLTDHADGEPGLGDVEFDGDSLDFSAMSSEDQTDGSDSAGLYGELDLAGPVSFSSFGQEAVEPPPGDLDADVAALAAQLEAFEQGGPRFSGHESDAAPVSPGNGSAAVSEVRAGKASASSGLGIDFSNLSMVPLESAAGTATTAAPLAGQFSDGLGLSLTRRDGHEGLGAVLVLAGLGGPDAVRQLLSSLPEALRVPVLLYQHLEVGKHERLVEQLAKISRLPVELAQAGHQPIAGRVTLLPAGMTATADGVSLTFVSGTLDQLINALPPLESLIIVLSGAEPQLVPQILAVREAGGLVLAQDPEVCFDAAAAELMQRGGAAVYPALGLARQIATRWPQ